MFYSVNSVTKEHRANVIIRGIDWFSVEADALLAALEEK